MYISNDAQLLWTKWPMAHVNETATVTNSHAQHNKLEKNIDIDIISEEPQMANLL